MKRFAVMVLVLLWFVPVSHAQDPQPPRSIMLERSVTRMEWSPDSRYIAFLATDDHRDTNVQVVEVNTGELVADFDYSPTLMAWSPDSIHLAVNASRDTGEYVFYGVNNLISVTILNIHTGEEQLIGKAVDINSFAWSPDGTQLAITTAEYMSSDAYRSTVQIWDASTGETIAILDDGAQWYINSFWYTPVWSPDGMRLAVLNAFGTVAVWDVSHQEQQYEISGFSRGANVVAWSPSGDLLAASDGHVIRTWNASYGDPLTAIQESALNLRWVNANQLAIVGQDSISLIDPFSGRISDTLESGLNLADSRLCIVWSPDGYSAALADDHEIRIISVQNALPQAQFSPSSLTLVDPPSPLSRLPADTEPITAANARQLALLGQLGRDDISDVLWSPDGSTIALLGTHGVWLYDDPTLSQPPRLLQVANGEVSTLLFSPDSHYLVLALKNEAAQDFGIRFWDIQSSEVARVLEGHTAPVTTMDFSTDGSLLATGSSDLSIRLWDVQTGQLMHVFWDHVDTVLSVDFNPDASQLVSAGDSLVRVWDVQTGELLERYDGDTGYWGQDPRVVNAQFSPDGSKVFFYYLNLTWQNVGLRIGPPDAKGECVGIAPFRASGFVGNERRYEIAFSPDGSILIPYTTAGSWLSMWDANTGAERTQGCLPCVIGSGAVTFSPDGATLAIGVSNNMACDSCEENEPRTIWLWDMRTGVRRAVLHGLVANTNRLVFSPDSRRLLSVSTDDTIRLWDVETGEMLRVLTEFRQPVSHLAFDSAGALMSLEAAREEVVIRRNGQPIKSIGETYPDPAIGANPPIVDVIANPDYSIVMAGETGFSSLFSEDCTAYRRWDAVTGERMKPFAHLTCDYFSSRAINPAGTLLASSKQGTVKLWDIRTWTEQQVLLDNPELSVGGLTFSPDGRLLAGAIGQYGTASRAIKLWDLTTEMQRSIVLPDPEANILALTFSPDGQYIAAQTQTSEVWIVSLHGNAAPGVLHAGVEDIRHVAFSQDAALVALATNEGTQLWDRATGARLGSWATSSIRVAFNQAGTLLASGESDGTVRLWGVR